MSEVDGVQLEIKEIGNVHETLPIEAENLLPRYPFPTMEQKKQVSIAGNLKPGFGLEGWQHQKSKKKQR